MKVEEVYAIAQGLFDNWVSCDGCKYHHTKEAIHTEHPCFSCIRPIIFKRNDNYKNIKIKKEKYKCKKKNRYCGLALKNGGCEITKWL